MEPPGGPLRRSLATLLVLLGAIAAAGCAAGREPLYRWGRYEDLVYATYLRPGDADPQTQIPLLLEDVERARAEGARVPPGIHAHLGYLYAGEGRLDLAREHLEIEKQLFPESAVFVDGLLGRLTP